MKLTLAQAAQFMGASGDFDPAAVARGYSIDTRTLQPGDLFFAVRGERSDGHEYAAAAIEQGAVAVVIARSELWRYEKDLRFVTRTRRLVVDDTLAALQALGAAVRRRWGKTLVAVTGSTGKTTTKEAIAHLLATRFRVLKSEGNLNNHFGLPLQLLRLEPEHDAAVMELAMSHPGEIAALTRLAQPEMGVVTNVAPVHLGFFSSVAEIARAKHELVAGLSARGTAVLNADDEYVSQFGRDFKGKVVTFALARPADVCAERIEDRGKAGSAFALVAGGRREPVVLPLLGRHNVYNALAAVAVALEQGVSPAQAAAALATLAPSDKRGQLLELAGATVINDCYNSNPRALDAMVDVLAGMPAARRIVVAGEMLELGPTGEELHRRCGARIAEKGIGMLVGVRGLAQAMVEAARSAGMQALFLPSAEEAGEWLAREVRPGDSVLLKASRGVKLEQALETWKARLDATAPPAQS